MSIFSRYLIFNIFLGFAAAAALLLPLFTTFDFISELDDVSSNGYHWTMALLIVLMKLPRCLVDLGPFIALLGGIVGLGQLSKSMELTAMRVVGFSIFRIGLVVLFAGLILTTALSALDEWIASPLQQRALQIKEAAIAGGDNPVSSENALWARHNNEFVTVKALDNDDRPIGIEIFRYKPDLTLATYIYAEKAEILKGGMWRLISVNQKSWQDGKEITEMKPELQWQSLFPNASLKELFMPGDSFSVSQLNHYISYLQSTDQPSSEFKFALWQKSGRPVLIIAMILLSVPFTFSNPRSPGLGSRLAAGVIVGLLTYICYQIIVNLGLLFTLSPPLITLAPPVILLFVALGLIYRFDQHH